MTFPVNKRVTAIISYAFELNFSSHSLESANLSTVIINFVLDSCRSYHFKTFNSFNDCPITILFEKASKTNVRLLKCVEELVFFFLLCV